MIVVAIIGILAAVAIPAFVRYIEDAKSTEFRMNLKAIAEGATVYYNTDQPTSNGLGIDPDRFPASVPLTPTTVTCDKKPANVDWTAWNDLRFDISKPFLGHYSWELVSTGVGNHEGVAAAQYDVDCDGDVGTTSLTVKQMDGVIRIGTFNITAED